MALLIVGLTTGCDGAIDPSLDGVAGRDADTASHTSDSGGSGGDSTTSSDAVAPRSQDVADTDLGPIFQVGTNVTGANTPDSFSQLDDGDELYIELGFQGLWMVVLAFRTRDVFEGDITIITRIYVDDVVQGELGLAKQKLHPGGNNLDYYYNLSSW